MAKRIHNEESPVLIHIHNLTVSVDNKKVLHNLNLQINAGMACALMGPNGSGKSSLAYTIMGHPKYDITQGSMQYQGRAFVQSTDERARNGIFLAMQTPIEVPGLSVYTLLKEAVRARNVEGFSLINFSQEIEHMADIANVPRRWLHRPLDSGFSGGEKKRLELLQLLVLKPVVAILDEIDSGLDADAIMQIGQILNTYREQNPLASLLVISHQKRFLDIIKPDHLHIMQQGAIVRSGNYSLIDSIELGGYDAC